MSENKPWWMGDSEDSSESGSSPGKSWDTSAWSGQITQMVSWLQGLAQQRIVEPHAQHGDPSEHPTCVLCRAEAFVDASGPVPTSDDARNTPIHWVPTIIDRTLP